MNKKLLVLAALSTLVLAGCPNGQGGGTEPIDPPAPEIIQVSEVKLDKSTLTLEVSKSAKLTATVSPDNASNKEVTWSTLDAGVATVDQEGNVTAVAAGQTTIKATSKQNPDKFAECAVTVTPAAKTKDDLQAAISALGDKYSIEIHVEADVTDYDGEVIPAERTYKGHFNDKYSYVEGLAGIAYHEEVDEGYTFGGYYFVENYEDSFYSYWGNVYETVDEYLANEVLSAVNPYIKAATASNLAYSKTYQRFLCTEKNVISALKSAVGYDYFTDTAAPAVTIDINDGFVVNFVAATKQTADVIATATFKAVTEDSYPELDAYLSDALIPEAPLSADDVAYYSLLNPGIYTQYHDCSDWGDMVDINMGGVETHITPYTQTVIYDDFSWAEGKWDTSDKAVIHTALQMTQQGFELSKGGIMGETGVVPADFEGVEFSRTDDPDLIEDNLDFGTMSLYVNPQNFADSGYFNIFNERYSLKYGQLYELRPGDKYYDSKGTEYTVDQDLLSYIARSFNLYYNLFDNGYIVNFSPLDIKSIFLQPVYKDDIETPENLEEIIVAMDADYYFMQIRCEKDEQGNYIRDDEGHVIPILDDEGHYIWDEVLDDDGEPYGVVASGLDYTYFGDFGSIDPFYRVSGLKDVAFLYEVVDGQIVGLFDGELTAETSENVYLRTNVLEGEVELTSADEDLVTVAYDATTGIHTLTADEFAGNTVLNATVGDEALAQFGVEVKIPLYEMAGTYELEDFEVTHSLVITGNETDGYTITFDGNPCNLVARDENVLTFTDGDVEIVLTLTGDGVGSLFIQAL